MAIKAWWKTNETNFRYKVVEKFIKTHAPLVLAGGSNGRCAQNFLSKIMTHAKTRAVNSCRAQLRNATSIPNFRIWMKNTSKKEPNVHYSFLSNCYYELRDSYTGKQFE